MFKRVIGVALLVLGLAANASAQIAIGAKTAEGTIDANGEAVTLTSPAVGPDGWGTFAVQLVGTYDGDIQVKCSVDGTNYPSNSELRLTPPDSTTAVTTINTDAEGVWKGDATGCKAVQVVATAWTSGSVAVSLRAGYTGGGGGGGGGSASEVSIAQGGNTATVSAGGELAVTCADCSGSGVSHVDDAGFTAATDDVVPIAGVFDDNTPDSVNEGDAGALRMSANRNLYTTIRDAAGNERGVNVTANNELLVELGAGSAAIGTVTVTDGAGSLNTIVDSGTITAVTSITNAVTVTDGSGALNVIIDSGTTAVTNTGTFATQVDGAALTALQLIDNVVSVEDAVAGSAFSGVAPLVVRQDSHSDLCADADFCPLTIDADGGLRVSIVAGAGSGGTALADDADFTAGTTSFTPAGGFYQSSVTACTDGDTCAFGITAQRTLKVTLFSAAGQEITASTDVTEDAGETAGGTGPMVLNVRRDTAASSAGTTGDNATFNTDALGLLWTRQLDPCSGTAKTYIPIDIVTATTTELTSSLAGASTHYYICSINLVSGGANNVAIVDDDSDNCASVTAGIFGGTTAGEGWNFAANGGIALGNGQGSIGRTNGTNRVICAVTSAAVQLSGMMVVAAAP